MSYGVRLRVSGPQACWTRPEMKAERVSYDVMTPSAARGILETIHWKPAIVWIVDAIHVLKPIRFQTLRRNELGSKIPVGKVKSALKSGNLSGLGQEIQKDRQQRASTILVDVDYVIEAHFQLTARAGDSDSIGKHLDIFNRRAAAGQCFHQPCLGTREFPADFSLIPHDQEIPEGERPPDADLGFMLHDMVWAEDKTCAPSFFRASLRKGVVRVPAPDSAEVYR